MFVSLIDFINCVAGQIGCGSWLKSRLNPYLHVKCLC